MARVGDYIAARRLAAEKLARQPLAEIIARSGLMPGQAGGLLIRFLDRTYHIQYPFRRNHRCLSVTGRYGLAGRYGDLSTSGPESTLSRMGVIALICFSRLANGKGL